MNGDGKMFVVVAVILVMLLGIAAFLIYLNKELTKLKNKLRDE